MATKIELVDQPDKPVPDENGFTFGPPESQRTYKVTFDNGVRQTVRIRRDDQAYYKYVVENLVSGKWHKLLTGDVVVREVPFDAAIARAAAVLE